MAAGKPAFMPPSGIVVVYDYETTGVDADVDEPIEIAALAIDTRKCPAYPEVGRFPARIMRVQNTSLLNQDYRVRANDTVELIAKSIKMAVPQLLQEVPNLAAMLDTPGTLLTLPCTALGINGKTRQQVTNGEDPKKVHEEFVTWCGRVTGAQHGTVRTMLAGHNVQFDMRFFKAALARYMPDFNFESRYDYHDMCSHKVFHFRHVMVTKQARFSNLVRATTMYGIPHSAHEAMGDVEATCEVFRRMAAEELSLAEYKRLASILPHVLYGTAGDVDFVECEELIKKVFPSLVMTNESTFPVLHQP